MGRYDSHKFPFHYQMNAWSNKRINTRLEREAKSIPCHVTQVDKDFITVAFETQNGIFTPPTVKIPQSMSPYGRNPTQVGDKGYAVPGNYYLGGVTGDAGGSTDFYPRGNLTTLSFEHTSHTQNPQRDQDQLTHMGGPNGWIVGPFQGQQQGANQGTEQSNSSVGGSAVAVTLNQPMNHGSVQMAMRSGGVRRLKALPVRGNRPWAQPRDGSIPGIPPVLGGIIGQIPGVGQITGAIGQIQGALGGLTGALGGLGGQGDNKTQFSFDKNFKAIVQSMTDKYSMIVDSQNKHAHLSVDTGGKAYIGGNGQDGQYALIATVKGPSINSYARIG